ncbi:MAG: hypothetical protein U0X76_12120 [Bacteroidia bacterium]
MNDILRSGFGEISDSTKVYFRDTYDHCIQLMDIVESCRGNGITHGCLSFFSQQ